MKIALYKDLQYDFTGLCEVSDWQEKKTDKVRLTEPVEVEFTYLPPAAIVPQEVAALEAAKEEASNKYHRVVATIDEKISKLLAITHEDKS